VALAVQLARRPRLLLLDEPLAGLDWRTRGELVALLAALKRECTVLVVSHDLRELAPLVDAAWEMRPGGRLGAADARALPMLQ
jgi:energy-coupling factor transporter ATP-binding protein EcfA2